MGRKVQFTQQVYPGESSPKVMGAGALVFLVGLLFVAIDTTRGFGALLIFGGIVTVLIGAQKRRKPCPNCRTMISPRAQVCPQCQAPLVAQTQQAPPPVTYAPTVAQQPQAPPPEFRRQ